MLFNRWVLMYVSREHHCVKMRRFSDCAHLTYPNPVRSANQRTYDVMMTSLLRQNNVATPFWRNNDVIITPRVRRLLFEYRLWNAWCKQMHTWILYGIIGWEWRHNGSRLGCNRTDAGWNFIFHILVCVKVCFALFNPLRIFVFVMACSHIPDHWYSPGLLSWWD